MKVILVIVGVLLILMGIVWFLQGINVLPGSFMTGQIQYSFAGVAATIAGTGLIVYSRRRKGAALAEEERSENAESDPGEDKSG